MADEWDIEYTDEFDDWYSCLCEDEQDDLAARIDMLAERGPGLGRPLVDQITTSEYPNMKELRCSNIRVLFAFDPRQTGILLLGGDKQGNWSSWYDENVPRADQLYAEYLDELREEGLL